MRTLMLIVLACFIYFHSAVAQADVVPKIPLYKYNDHTGKSIYGFQSCQEAALAAGADRASWLIANGYSYQGIKVETVTYLNSYNPINGVVGPVNYFV